MSIPFDNGIVEIGRIIDLAAIPDSQLRAIVEHLSDEQVVALVRVLRPDTQQLADRITSAMELERRAAISAAAPMRPSVAVRLVLTVLQSIAAMNERQTS